MVEHTICSTCQADISGVAGQHLDETMHAGYYSGWRKEQTGTKTYTVNHPEQGHYESIVTGYNVAVEQFNEMEVYNHITDWFRIEKRLRRGIWFRLCDGSDFFKNDYRTTRYGPHDLHSFGRGYRLISEKNDLHLGDQTLNGSSFFACMACSFSANGVKLVSKQKKSQFQKK